MMDVVGTHVIARVQTSIRVGMQPDMRDMELIAAELAEIRRILRFARAPEGTLNITAELRALVEALDMNG